MATRRYKESFKDDDDDEKKAFVDVFPVLVEHFKKALASRNLHELSKWFEQVLNYNVPHGKKYRGMAVVKSYKTLVNNATSEQMHIARIVGWCLETMQAYFLITDDIVDESLTRRGQPCWHKKENVGIMAINDSTMVIACVFQTLLKYIKDKNCRFEVEECFHDVIWHTSIGQCMDMLSEERKPGRSDLNRYTEDRLVSVAKYKSGYYTFCLPLHLALVLAGMKDRYTSSVEEFLLNIGIYYQIQNDYLDCFGDPKVTGKEGNDIEVGKCCWPIVMALQRVSAEDRLILEANYGTFNTESCQKVRQIYERIGLRELYHRYELDTYTNLCKKIEEVSRESNIPEAIFYDILNMIYKHNK